MDDINGIPEPIEGFNESLRNLTGDPETDLAEALQEATGEAVTEGIHDAVRDALLEEGHSEEADALADKGTEMLEREPSEYKQPQEEIEADPELPQKIGSEGTPRPHSYTDKPDKRNTQNIGVLGSNASKLTKHETLEAKKRGLERYIAEQCDRTYHDQSAQEFMERQRELAEEKIQEIEIELENLPPDNPAIKEAREKECIESSIKRGGKERFIEDMYSAGLNDGTDASFGFEGLGKLMDKISGVYARMRVPPQYWPEYQKPKYWTPTEEQQQRLDEAWKKLDKKQQEIDDMPDIGPCI